MAVTIDTVWTGATSNDWNVDTNWSNSKPATNGDAIIPAGTWNIDVSSATDQQYGVLHIAEGFNGSIGTSGNPLTASFTEIKHRGSGKLFFTDGTGTTTDVIINGPQASDLAYLSGTISQVSVFSGMCTLASGMAVLAVLEVGARGHVEMEANANAVTTLRQYGGVINSLREVTTLELIAGTFTQKRGSSTAIGTTAANVYPGATLYYENGTTITLLSVKGGVADLIRNRKDDLTVTTLERTPGAVVEKDGNLITVTNDTDWRN